MTRDEFTKAVFGVTKGKCCVPGCDCDAIDAHHIMNRHLWNDGGYILSNGAALCAKHHLEAETDVITPRQCMFYMKYTMDRIREPDKLKETITEDEYKKLLLNDDINSFGELK